MDAHAGCPGHAACLTNGRATYLCTRPDEYGHTRRRRTSYRTPEEQARDDAEEQAEAERRRTREVAADARLGFLAELISAAKAPARHHRLTGAALWTAERTIRAGHRELVAALLGVTPGDGDRWADAEELDTAYARYVDNLADQRGWRLSLAHSTAGVSRPGMSSIRLDRQAHLATVALSEIH